jgi:hypothetical protein
MHRHPGGGVGGGGRASRMVAPPAAEYDEVDMLSVRMDSLEKRVEMLGQLLASYQSLVDAALMVRGGVPQAATGLGINMPHSLSSLHCQVPQMSILGGSAVLQQQQPQITMNANTSTGMMMTADSAKEVSNSVGQHNNIDSNKNNNSTETNNTFQRFTRSAA